jgi:hypothetical protein
MKKRQPTEWAIMPVEKKVEECVKRLNTYPWDHKEREKIQQQIDAYKSLQGGIDECSGVNS